jgi:hypothetical protein
MSENSSERKTILDLPDEDLIKVFSYLDFCSQLDAMLVCRRFEALIGQDAQFYKNHKLMINRKLTSNRGNQSSSEDGPAAKKAKFMYFGRYFGDVLLFDYVFSPGSQFFPPLLDTFKIIGSKINKLEIEKSKCYKNPLLEVLQLANNVKELKIGRMEMIQNAKSLKCREFNVKKCTFPKLRSLELSSIENFGNIKKAFDAVDKLTHLKLGYNKTEDWGSYQQILFRQEDLRSLELAGVEVGSFEIKNWNIEKLVLKNVKFPKQEVFQTFVSFIKTLTNVSEVKLDTEIDEMENDNNYKEILEHLLNLPSLVKLEWHVPDYLLNIRNTSVESYVNRYCAMHNGNVWEIGQLFPNLQIMCLNSVWDTMYLLENLRELKFSQMFPTMLESINCPQLQKFSIDGSMEFTNSKVWKQFVERHPNIEYVELKAHNNWCLKFKGPHFIETFRYLPKLKTLKYHNITGTSNEMAVVKFIGFTLIKLEYLEIVVLNSNVVKSAEFLRSKFPHLGCDSRRLQKRRYSSLDWLITLRKF